MNIKQVTVYASSSRALDPVYYDAARRLGKTLADARLDIIFGGGGVGLMGAVADAALEAGGEVHGIIPDFLADIEHGHKNLTSMDVVSDMRIRKERLLERGQAVVTLPGGCGTFEELFEAMTMKRLGQYLGPIVLVNTNGYYERCVDFLEHSVSERFMSRLHADMWQVVDQPEDVLDALANAPEWRAEFLSFSSVAAEHD